MAALQPAASEAMHDEPTAWTLRRRLGLGLLLVMGGLVMLALYQARRDVTGGADCAGHGVPRTEVLMAQGVRIVYCIDFMGRDMRGGSEVYALGSAADDQVDIGDGQNDGFGPVELRRLGAQLSINGGRPLARGQSFSMLRLHRQLNPWLLASDLLLIHNAGMNLDDDILMVHGTLEEDWLPGPTGVLLTLLALALMRRD